MMWDDTRLHWISPSPNIKTSQTALAYPATCFIEATNLSEGRGTEKPFQYIGAPFMIDERMRMMDVFPTVLNALRLDGVTFGHASFTPSSSKFKDEMCSGVVVEVVDWKSLRPVATGLRIVQQAKQLYPLQVEIRESSLLRLIGSREAYKLLVKGVDVEEITKHWEKNSAAFRKKSAKYFLY
jgi:uncharacterized protein YbbC (DUF1343 family)